MTKRIRHRKLIITVVVCVALVGALLALAQDQMTLKIQSAHAADDREFPSYAAALDCYSSPEYVAAMKEREGRSVWDMAITEGYEGLQPG